MTRLWYFHELTDFDLLDTGVTARRYLTSKKATLSPSTSHCRNMGGRFEEGRGKRKEEHREPHAPEPVLFMLDKECKEHRYIMYIYIYTIFYMCIVDMIYYILLWYLLIDAQISILGLLRSSSKFLVLHPCYAPGHHNCVLSNSIPHTTSATNISCNTTLDGCGGYAM